MINSKTKNTSGEYIMIFAIIVLITNLYCGGKGISKEQLIGDWKIVGMRKIITKSNYINDLKSELPKPLVGDGGSYISFMTDSTIRWLNPFFLIQQNDKSKKEYIDIITKYKIKQDSLWILNPADSIWINTKITYFNNDTLIFQDNVIEYNFVKRQFQPDSSLFFDKVSISSNGCMGACPQLSIILDEKGHILFHGSDFIEYFGLYESEISKEHFTSYRNSFIKARFDTLRSIYKDAIDLVSVSIIFERKHKIIKSIFDMGYNSPGDFVNSYLSLINIYKKIELEKIETYNTPLIFSYRIKSKNNEINLNSSECFLLWNYLRKGKICKREIDDQYQLEFTNRFSPDFYSYLKPRNKETASESNNSLLDFEIKPLDIKQKTRDYLVTKVCTDGRYYMFVLNNGEKITIDIGFNFINNNYPLLMAQVSKRAA